MKLRYKIALLPFALPLLILGASTYALAGDDLSVSVTTDYTSKYVFRGVALAGGAFQPGAEVSTGNFTAGVWASVASGEESVFFSDEVDFYAGYSFALSGAISADVGATLYHYPQAGGVFDIGANDAGTVEVYGSLGFDAPLAPSVTAYYDISLEAFTLEGGAEYSVPVADKTSFDVSGAAGLVSANGGGDYQYGSVTGALSYGFTDTTSAYVSVNGGLSSQDTFFDTNFNSRDLTTISAPKSSGVWFAVGLSSGF